MPGIYGSVPFVIGSPSKRKPVQSGPCHRCGSLAYRQTFSPTTKVWRFEHDGCAPQVRVERRHTRAGAAMGYVPANYERSTTFDPALGAAITRNRRE